LFTFLNAIPAAESVVGNVIAWHLEDLPAGNTAYLALEVIAPDWQSMGETLVNQLTLNVFDPEGNITDTDVLFEEDELLCSYDPNDKQVFPEGVQDEHYVMSGTSLEYHIRFQNTGNYLAQNITVNDPLTDLLDWSTFEMIGSSHYCQPTLNTETGEVDFFFPDIMLPDSTSNEPGSHGFVRFRIDHIPNIPQPSVIENTAYIYFDTNPAVITNTTWTTIDDAALNIDEENRSLVSVYPNPASDNLTLNLGGNETVALSIVDGQGRVVYREININPGLRNLDISSLSPGIYTLRTQYSNGLHQLQFIKR
ncbi:MAG: T9SS type A sorting domain-containing protein, partial [Flavobacteriales bacterium]|nr:T9SS type A sorting domain-containing protein [Flavobacteriales bacterium]